MAKQIVATRTFNAPVPLVWQVWTDPELVMRWWGPQYFTSPSAKMDFRVGGTSIVCMRAPENFGGGDTYSIWQYTKIVPMQTIEFIQNLADKNGNRMKPTDLGMPPDFPEDILTVVTFVDLGNNTTEMTITEYADMGSMSEFAKLGLEQCMDKIVQIFS